ncbi:MAG: ankyrin repeat domain-containing protein, partial [Rickettsiales bacterium]|nr:ankyrin repeat domain-containing protein [Rickettsiales bacterium]
MRYQEKKAQTEGQKIQAIALLNQFMQDEGFRVNGISVPFTLANFAPGHPNTVAQLIEEGDTLLIRAAKRGRLDLAHILIDQLKTNPSQARANDRRTPLLIASEEGRVAVVDLLLGRGADVNQARTSDGTTPLLMAS